MGFGSTTSSGLRSTCGGFEVLAGVLPTTSGKNLRFSLWTRAFEPLSVGDGGYHTGMSLGVTPHAGPVQVLAAARSQIADLTEILWAAQPDDEIIGLVEEANAAG